MPPEERDDYWCEPPESPDERSVRLQDEIADREVVDPRDEVKSSF